jgi:hypothetical protein
MAKRKSKRISTANQAAPSFQTYRYPKPKITPSFHTSPYPKPKTIIEPPPSRAVKLVLDAFNKAGISFDPSNKADADWLAVLEARFAHYDDPVLSSLPFPGHTVQDGKSRRAVECLLSALKKLRSAILFVKKEAARADIPAAKQNVALNVLTGIPVLDEDPSPWLPNLDDDTPVNHWEAIQNFENMLTDLEWSTGRALQRGIHASHGKSKTLVEYMVFISWLYDLWAAKKSQIGAYKSGGRYTGPFVQLVERCEELLPSDLRPPSADARGKRVARAIGVHKKAKPS